MIAIHHPEKYLGSVIHPGEGHVIRTFETTHPMTHSVITIRKFLSKGILSKCAGLLLFLICFQIQGTAQKQSQSFTASLSVGVKNQIMAALDISSGIRELEYSTVEKIPVVNICPTEWLGQSALVKSYAINKSKTIQVASEKLPSGGHNLFYAVDGNQKFIRFPKK